MRLLPGATDSNPVYSDLIRAGLRIATAMANSNPLSTQDRAQLAGLGIELEEVDRQLGLFRHPPAPAELLAPCRVGEGITRIPEDQQPLYVERWLSFGNSRSLAKFIPASGAATRMFRDLTALHDRQTLEPLRQGLGPSPPNFAFRQSLIDRLALEGVTLDPKGEVDALQVAVRCLLDEAGLGYRDLPKGLIPFHHYPSGARTAVIEHLWEGAPYLVGSSSSCRFHFTVTAEHEQAFQDHVDRARAELQRELGTELEVEFSNQSPATDTVAVDLQNQPVRRANGELLLRPAGHGALLENLQQVDADAAILKNIDNISHQRLHGISIHWKKVLIGYFAELQETVFSLLSNLEGSPDSAQTVSEALDFLQTRFATQIPSNLAESDLDSRHRFAHRTLDRPIRVCGVVENVGEPGGGPFWIRGANGEVSGQIIEGAQVDTTSANQTRVWSSSTHFNPVDLVCGLRNRQGKPYQLAEYLDPASAFVTEKSAQGQPVKALERPGLWNGSMAHWNTAFVEIPLATFTPVKTVFDLLRPEHQP